MSSYDPLDFLKQLAPHILADLKPPGELKRFTANPDIVGSYVEAGVRRLVGKYLAPIRVSSGAVIDQGQSPGGKKIPQLDTIAWIPGPVPAVFQAGEFALVPRSSCLGILEVKSSAYDVGRLEERTSPEFVNSVTADLDPLGHEGELNGVRDCFGMGVISILLMDQRGSQKLEQLRQSGRVAVLFEERDDEAEAQPEDIYRLVNFLAMLRLRAAKREGQIGINLNLFKR